MANLVACVLTAALLWGCAAAQSADPRFMRFKEDSQSSMECKGAVAREQGMCEFGNPGLLSGRPGCQQADAEVQRSC
jgi:hypothetical protein